ANGLNGARRISATRKATAPLKAWLTDHGTYPYPTKDEKVVPAVTAMMTLTQSWGHNLRVLLSSQT
ncbi:hypothetical protein KIN20_009649, partial [Parelaphostrongylus tenuis]